MLTYEIDSAISLKLLDEQYAGAIFKVVENNREQFSPWFDWVESKRVGVYWLIFHNGNLVGQVFLIHIDWDDRSGEIGFWLDRGATGKGIMTKACDVMLRFAFDEWKLHRISLNADVENQPSQAVADRLGFVYEGTKRESIFINKQYRNIKQYSLLKQEYKPLKK